MVIMFGFGKIHRIGRKGRAIDETINRMGGTSRKMNKRSTIDPQFTGRPKYVSGIGGGKNTKDGTYPKYEKAVNKTQPVTSPRKLQASDGSRDGPVAEKAKKPQKNPTDFSGDNAINRIRNRINKGGIGSLLPHQTSAWSKYKSSVHKRWGY